MQMKGICPTTLLLLLALKSWTTFAYDAKETAASNNITPDSKLKDGQINSLEKTDNIPKWLQKICQKENISSDLCKNIGPTQMETLCRMRRKFSTKELFKSINNQIAENYIKVNETNPEKSILTHGRNTETKSSVEKREIESNSLENEQDEETEPIMNRPSSEYFYDHPIDAFSAIHSFNNHRVPDDADISTASNPNNEPLASIKFLLNAHKRSPGFRSWGGKRTPFGSWGGKRDKSTKFSSWGGKRSYFQEDENSMENDDMNSDKRSGFNSWGGKRAKFQSWGGKRNEVGSTEEDDTDSLIDKRRTFQSWGGKRYSTDRYLNDFLKNEDNQPFSDAIKRSSFNSWGGKRQFLQNMFSNNHKYLYPRRELEKFLNWGGKRKFSSWGGKRSVTSDDYFDQNRIDDKRGIVRPYKKLWSNKEGRSGSYGFSSWGGKRDSSQGFHSWGGKRDHLDAKESESYFPYEETVEEVSNNGTVMQECPSYLCNNELNLENENTLSTVENENDYSSQRDYSGIVKRSISEEGNEKVGLLAAAALLSDTQKPIGLSVGIYNRRKAEFFPWAGKREE